jgi:hypothetical protein
MLPSDDRRNLLIAVAGARNAGISMVIRLFADWSGAAIPVTGPDAASTGAGGPAVDNHEES